MVVRLQPDLTAVHLTVARFGMSTEFMGFFWGVYMSFVLAIGEYLVLFLPFQCSTQEVVWLAT